MTIPDEISGNVTGLLFAEEASPKTLDGSPIWYRLEPNSYAAFGGNIKTVSRRPINPGRQQRKGTVVDVDAKAGYNTDVTKTNVRRQLRQFFCSDWYEKATTVPWNDPQIDIGAVTTADDRYAVSGDGDDFLAGMLILAAGFTASGNNGLKLVDESSALYVGVSTNLTNEASPPTDASLVNVGFQFATGAASLDESGGTITLNVTGIVKALGTLTISAANNALDTETVTIGGKVYTFQTVLTDVDGHVLIGANKAASLANLSAAINLGTGAGTLYATLTTEHPSVTANGASPLVITAKVAGTAGNAIGTTETLTDGSFGAVTLLTGAGIDLTLLGISVNEWHFIGGDTAANCFATFLAGGYARVSAVNFASIVYDKITWTAADDAGAAKDIQLFYGEFIKNEEDPDNQVFRTAMFERTLGSDGTGIQSEIVEGGSADEFSLTFPTADKLTADMSYTGLDVSYRTGTEGPLSEDTGATIVEAPNEEAINSSSNIYRVRATIVDGTTLAPTPFFAYFESGNLKINNNYKPRKAVSVVGAFKSSPGMFSIMAECKFYFGSIAAIQAMRANTSITWDAIVATENKGYVYDIPLLTAQTKGIDVKLDDSIMVPLEQNGFEGPNGFTLGLTFFPYLPDAGMADS